MHIGVATENFPGETRVALVPVSIASLKKAGLDVLIEKGAGIRAGFTDAAYQEKGAELVATRGEIFGAAEVILQVRIAGAAGEQGREDLALMKSGQILIGTGDPLGAPEGVREMAARGVTAFALELMPRITRAQSMDVLSSMATIAGYKAVLLAAGALPRMFPLLTTAAGTFTPAPVFIVGVGVAGLQAISTARRLGAVVEAYDVRPAVKEQVQSVGAKFVELPLDTAQAEGKGGYAKEQDESFYQRQREMMARVVASNDVMITTAVVPGKRAPVLVTAEMIRGMAPGSVVVDLAAERGGNCELTRADRVVVEQGVMILGPTNLPSTVPYHASQMYARNITTFLLHLIKDGKVRIDASDEITRDTLVAERGEVVNPRVREVLGLPGMVGASD
jgi:NAD(P) transhydrogenase subunit alpha